MTVRLTTSESEIVPQQPIPTPPGPSDEQVTTPVAPVLPDPLPESAAEASETPSVGPSETPAVGPTDPETPTAADTRRALREAREHRRRTAWLCAAVVALCLGLTIVVVTLARYRPVASPAAAPAHVSAYSVSHPTAPHQAVTGSPVTSHATTLVNRVVRVTVPTRGAPAPEGGNP